MRIRPVPQHDPPKVITRLLSQRLRRLHRPRKRVGVLIPTSVVPVAPHHRRSERRRADIQLSIPRAGVGISKSRAPRGKGRTEAVAANIARRRGVELWPDKVGEVQCGEGLGGVGEGAAGGGGEVVGFSVAGGGLLCCGEEGAEGGEEVDVVVAVAGFVICGAVVLG